jgi:F0F1-type ATP synthase membrane subunit b/b'
MEPPLDESEESQKATSDFDMLSIQMFSNKNHYKKYLAKTNPEKYSEQQELLKKISKNREKINAMFSSLLENPEKQITTDINESFEQFVKACINHFHMEKLSNLHDKDADDYEISSEEEDNQEYAPTTSYWGASIIKKPAHFNTMDAFVKRR